MKTIKKTLLMLSRFDVILRHYPTSLKHLNMKKIKNILVNEMELLLKRKKISSRPFFIQVEPTPLCHLRCPGCQHGREETKNRFPKGAMLSYRNFIRIIEPLAKTLVGVSLSSRGDSLINPEIFHMIQYCHENNIGTVFPTNFSYNFNKNEIEHIVDSGLSHLIVSIDGITQEIYEKYRKGGSLKRVLENCKKLMLLKQEKKVSTPLIEFKFIKFSHNQHQFNAAKKLSQSMGFDRFSCVLANEHPQRIEEEKKIISHTKNRKRACYWPYHSMVVFWDGQVSSCCNDNINMGNALVNNTLSIWNNEEYQGLRSFFSRGIAITHNAKHCQKCKRFWGND